MPNALTTEKTTENMTAPAASGVRLTREVRLVRRRPQPPVPARHHDARRAWAIALCLMAALAWFVATEIVLSPSLFGR